MEVNDPTVMSDVASESTIRRSFRVPQACRLVKISYRQLDYWARTGLVVPSVEDANGSGSQRLYSYSDLLALKFVKRLLDAGLSLPAIRHALSQTKSTFSFVPEQLTYLLVTPKSVTIATGEELVELLQRGGLYAAVIVAFNSLRDELDADVFSLKQKPEFLQPSLFETMSQAV